jgi:hypothetical protein
MTADVAAFEAKAVQQGSQLVTGIAKVGQRFLLILLTQPGSLVYEPLSGCAFTVDMEKGRWRTAADVLQSFASALLDVQRQMRSLETTTDPPNELFANAVLAQINLPLDGPPTLTFLLSVQDGAQQALMVVL